MEVKVSWREYDLSLSFFIHDQDILGLHCNTEPHCKTSLVKESVNIYMTELSVHKHLNFVYII